MTFREVLTFRNIPWRPHASNPNELKVLCPFCGDERLLLSINERYGKGFCFNARCGWKSSNGTIEKVLRALSIAGQVEFQHQEQKKELEKLRLPEGFYPLAAVTPEDELGQSAVDYLMRRGITREEQNKHRFGCTFIGRMSYRVVMPIWHKRELVMLVARDITGQSEKKYLNSIGPKYFWGLPHVSRCVKPLILCEGIFKALALRRTLGLSASMMGLSITDQMLEHLLEAGHRSITVWPDPGKAGVEGAIKLVRRLGSAGIATTIPVPLPNWQADEKIEQHTLVPVTPNLVMQIKLEYGV